MTEDLTNIDGVGDAIAEQLREAGFETVADVEGATVDELADVHMLGELSARAILDPADDAAKSKGRPSEFTDERAREAVAAMPDAKSVSAVENKIGVGRGTIDNGDGEGWLYRSLTYVDEDGNEQDFSEAFRRARGDTHADLINEGLYDDDADSSFVKFILATSYDHKKTGKQEVEHSGEINGERTLGDDELAAIRRGLSVSEDSDT